MALTVEDGTGKADADAFVSLAYVNTYHSTRGTSAWTGEDADKETAIVRASAFLSTAFTWQGLKRNGRSQALAWPRYGVVDDEGNSVPYDEVPSEIALATAEIALRELATPGAMTPDYTPSLRVKSSAVRAGPVASTTEYDMSRTDAESVRPILLAVRDIVGPLLASNSGGGMFGEVVRG